MSKPKKLYRIRNRRLLNPNQWHTSYCESKAKLNRVLRMLKEVGATDVKVVEFLIVEGEAICQNKKS